MRGSKHVSLIIKNKRGCPNCTMYRRGGRKRSVKYLLEMGVWEEVMIDGSMQRAMIPRNCGCQLSCIKELWIWTL